MDSLAKSRGAEPEGTETESLSATVRRIRKLAPRLINKIAAGEVVERPASVVKELVENSLDAGAKRIEVRINGGGLRLIEIVDDGSGIAREDLRLAMTSHATSKIRTAEDLFRIGSLGFRGEALASIGSVSHMRLASRPEGEAGAELRVNGGAVGKVKAVGLPKGTRIEVGDLFYNVPARRAFLRTERGETQAALRELKQQALSRPNVSFFAWSEGKVALEAPATDEPRERIAQLLGRELSECLLALPYKEGAPGEEEGMRLRGYYTPCDRSRGDSRQQHFFLNGRAIRDVTLLMAVKQAYDSLLPPRRYASVLLWLDLEPDQVDVNVHPQKAEVRFRKERVVFRRVQRALREGLRAEGLVGELRLGRHVGAGQGLVGGGSFGGVGLGTLPASPGSSEAQAAPGALGPLPGAPPLQQSLPMLGGSPEAEATPELGRFLQIHRRYVLEETAEGVRVVDPHALHERILYEQIAARLDTEVLESQRFLFPTLVSLSPDALHAWEERGELLTRLGFEVAPFGANTLAVHAAPSVLTPARVGETLETLLREPQACAEGERPGLLHGLAASLACRSAVRFGQLLSQDQIAALLRQRELVANTHCCPHGRPTALALRLDELDHRFGRQGLQR